MRDEWTACDWFGGKRVRKPWGVEKISPLTAVRVSSNYKVLSRPKNAKEMKISSAMASSHASSSKYPPGAHNSSTIKFFGGIVLCVAAFDGLLLGFK
jgi:hypothetical protein